MATRGKTTFQKRQKEMARKEKQQMKEQRRAQRKLLPSEPEMGEALEIEALEPEESDTNLEPFGIERGSE